MCPTRARRPCCKTWWAVSSRWRLPACSRLGPYIESGRLKTLAVTGTQRMDALPKIATMSEQGIKDEVFQVTGWFGMSALPRRP